ncbi:hypothetical protein N7539_005519 [Penicillium diatomitis]|uniref:Uncharacterized protein n=1 Tax=Penicillium diatomitis TaxID=2819901 RepID=A0A9W9X7G4_9EURO|nr:uncharacterized protein N7539_005519 [Penicillium diatomitis]KAJ5485531.1 hypothetical protein N7539_005519 [Penicillium diatomitis]
MGSTLRLNANLCSTEQFIYIRSPARSREALSVFDVGPKWTSEAMRASTECASMGHEQPDAVPQNGRDDVALKIMWYARAHVYLIINTLV